MDLYLYIAIIFYFGTILFLPFILWNSKKNIVFFQTLPFSMIAYFFGGIYFINYSKENYGVKDDILEFYTIILLVSTIIFIIFYIWGFFSKGYILKKIKGIYLYFDTNNIDKVSLAGVPIAIITIVLFIVSFYGIGFIPIFAENPFAAKYMSGEYQDAYRAFAIPYRVALNLSNIAIILLIMDFFIRRKRAINIILVLIIIICLIFSMRRGIIVSGLISLVFSYMAYQSKFKFSLVVISYIIILTIGAASNDIFLYTIGLRDNLDLTSILRGAPDIADQLFFLHHWINDYWNITWGLNYIGALIPYHSEYNLAVITLNVIGSVAGEVSSGGFRLPIPMIGYISFDWFGLIICSALFAYVSGIILCLKREILENISLKKYIMLNILLFPYVIGIFEGIFKGITLDMLLGCLVVAFIFYRSK